MIFKAASLVAICSGALIAQTASLPSKAAGESNQAGRLMKQIKAEAEQIKSSAASMERLAQTKEARWQDYDLQWNMIKPAQERLDMAMRRLDSMQASLSPAERKTLDQTKRDVGAIAGATHDLWTKLGQPKVDLNPPALSADARHLDQAARDLIKATASTS